ncbi:PREDICTED: transmembrane protein 192 [Nanorana parkeri]|uniref:transmembrane protein 192 n=1 Tax=Nanorana parkeri TaxID=125878 RepID=UPI00085417E0|nr:PREDICTED: transmembrane protein 192 [Nanorana parkeri]
MAYESSESKAPATEQLLIWADSNIKSSGELTQSADDDCLLDAPLLPSQKLQSEIRRTFLPVPTVCVCIVLLLLQVAFVALTAVSGYFCLLHGDEDECKTYTDPFRLTTIVIMCKVILWLLHVVNERFVQYHHAKARNRGYLKLYRSTRNLKTMPLIIHSTGNAAILLIISAKDFFKDDNLYLYIILCVLILELIFSVIFLLMYTVHMCKFNRSQPDADIIEEQKIHSFQAHVNPGIGFREGSSLEEIIEKQGDTIEYLQRHNALLSQQLLAGKSQLSREQTRA